MKLKYEIIESTTIKEFIYKHISRNFYGYLKELNAIFLVNDLVKKAYEEVNSGDILEIVFEDLNKQEGHLNETPLKIIFEDENYLVIDKEPHLQTIPSTKNPYDSVFNRCLAHFKNTNYTCHIINRLDKETSGLILIAKNKLACIMLKEMHKVYLAKTYHFMPKSEGKITLAIDKEETGIKRFVNLNSKNKAITNYKYDKTLNKVNYYKVYLETGKTHQIRVHFAYFKCPLINDILYNKLDPLNGDLGLICLEISFLNPFNKEVYRFISNYN